MLHAILNKKLGRSIDSQEVHWSALFKASEDSLTSTVFGSLLHLPADLFWQILKRAAYTNELDTVDENIETVEFWPHWNATRSDNKNYVEPDVFIRTKNYDIIIEAKRYDDKQQDEKQWLNELKAYSSEYGSSNKTVIMLALGGVHNIKSKIISNGDKVQCTVVKCRWVRVLDQVKQLRNAFEKRDLTATEATVHRISKDLINGFAVHGFYTGDWFEHQGLESMGTIDESSLNYFIECNQHQS